MLSMSSKYAVRALLYLADQPGERFISVEELASKTGVPAPYLSKVMKVLARGELIEAKRGPQGGVRFTKPRATLFEVCTALEDPVVVFKCLLSNERCTPTHPCALHDRWSAERERLTAFLHTTVIERATS